MPAERPPQPEDSVAILIGESSTELADRLANLLACPMPTVVPGYGIVLRCERDRFEAMLDEVAL